MTRADILLQLTINAVMVSINLRPRITSRSASENNIPRRAACTARNRRDPFYSLTSAFLSNPLESKLKPRKTGIRNKESVILTLNVHAAAIPGSRFPGETRFPRGPCSISTGPPGIPCPYATNRRTYTRGGARASETEFAVTRIVDRQSGIRSSLRLLSVGDRGG